MARQSVIADAVLGAVTQAVVEAAANPLVPLDAPGGRSREAARHVRQKVAEKVAADPAVQHVTNTEPWYQSRVTIGALISFLAMGAAAAGFTLQPEERELLVTLALAAGGLVGPATTLYGRWKARRPIGS